MEVILLESVSRLGGIGDTVNVANGYGRNFLIPKNKALRATAENKKIFEERRHLIEEQNAKSKSEAQDVASKLGGLSVNLVRQASQEGKLYGSVTVRDIADLLKEEGYDIPKSHIIITSAIKHIGEYLINISLHAEVRTNIKLNILRTESEMN
ncbi:MAG: 50S ribosomal protein L9 [Rickettsiales bacterium]